MEVTVLTEDELRTMTAEVMELPRFGFSDEYEDGTPLLFEIKPSDKNKPLPSYVIWMEDALNVLVSRGILPSGFIIVKEYDD